MSIAVPPFTHTAASRNAPAAVAAGHASATVVALALLTPGLFWV